MKNAIVFTEPLQTPGLRVGEIVQTTKSVKSFALTTANTDNLDTLNAGTIILVPDAANRILRGIKAPGSDYKRVLVINKSAFHVTLKDADAGSTAANRFDLGGVNFVIQPKRAVELFYDVAASRWLAMQNDATFAS